MENTTEENFDVQLRRDLEQARSAILGGANDDLLNHDFISSIQISDDNNEVLNNIYKTDVHIYNLLLLMFFFFLSKWLFDKCIIVFSDVSRRF